MNLITVCTHVYIYDPHLPFCSIAANIERTPRPLNRAAYKPNNSTFLERVKEDLCVDDIKPELTTANYREKFHKLLCWEEMEHITLLHDRLDMCVYLCRLAWVDQKRRQILYQRYIRATQVLYQFPIKTSGEDSCIATNEVIRNFAVVTIE